jgi:hypothetical protein
MFVSSMVASAETRERGYTPPANRQAGLAPAAALIKLIKDHLPGASRTNADPGATSMAYTITIDPNLFGA